MSALAFEPARVPYSDYMSAECWCGRAKASMHHFCGHCWRKTTRPERVMLEDRGRGYEGRYAVVQARLKRCVRVAKACPSKLSAVSFQLSAPERV